MKDELEKIIQKAAIDGTLTEAAAKQVQDVLAENKSLKTTVGQLEVNLTEKRNEVERLDSRNSGLALKLECWEKREADVAEREKKMTELELSAAHQAQRVADHQTMFGQVFRNSEIKRNVFTPVNAPVVDQYGNASYPGYSEHQQTETTE